MNRWLALAKEPAEKANPLPDTLTEPDKRGLCPVLSGCRVEKVEVERPHRPDLLQPSPDARSDPPRAFSVTGRPLTWTGRVVSLDEWRKLSAWDRHGQDGRMFCGACRDWVKPGCCPHTDGRKFDMERPSPDRR